MDDIIKFWTDKIHACKTVEEVREIWKKEWTPDDNWLSHRMGMECWLKIEALELTKEGEKNDYF